MCKKGNTYAALGDYHKAISDYECALKIKDDYYWAYHSEGDAYTALGDYEKALEKYDRALKLPNISSAWLAETHYKEGIVFAKKDEDPDAIKCYNKSLEKNKSNSWVLHSLGDSYAKLGRKQEDYKLAIDNYKKAIDNYKKAYKNNPLQYQSMQAWGEILIEEACCNNNLNPKPKLRLALRLFKRAAEIAEDSHKMDYHRIHIAIGDTYLRLGQYSDAVDNYNTAVEYFDTATSKIEDKPFKLWACRAYALEKQGDKEYEKQINSDRELISHYIGACERKVNNIFHSSFKKTQNNSQEPATTYYEIAVCYALIHETQKAIENLKKALDCDKKNEIRKWAKSEIGFIKLKLNPEFQNLIKPKESLNLTTDKVDLSDLT